MEVMNDLKKALLGFDELYRDYEEKQKALVTALTAVIDGCIDHQLHECVYRIDIFNDNKVMCFDETRIVISLFPKREDDTNFFMTFRELESVNKTFNGVTMFILPSPECVKIEMFLDTLCGKLGIMSD